MPRPAPKSASSSTTSSSDSGASSEGWSSEAPPAYIAIKHNTYARDCRPTLHRREIPVCSCEPVAMRGVGCGANCMNRMLFQECVFGFCPCGRACQNQRIQRGVMAHTRLQHMGSKGWGLIAEEDIDAGELVIEYVGEVLQDDESMERALQYEAEGVVHTYVMALSSTEVIDATRKGNVARFINHSCDPNCETQKWLVCGEVRVCIVARRDIAAGEEINYNYHLQWNGHKRVRCMCGAANCHGYLGGHSKHFKDMLRRHGPGASQEVLRFDDDTGAVVAVDVLDMFSSDEEEEDDAADSQDCMPAHLPQDEAAGSVPIMQQHARQQLPCEGSPGRTRCSQQPAAEVHRLDVQSLACARPDSSSEGTDASITPNASWQRRKRRRLADEHHTATRQQQRRRFKSSAGAAQEPSVPATSPATAAWEQVMDASLHFMPDMYSSHTEAVQQRGVAAPHEPAASLGALPSAEPSVERLPDALAAYLLQDPLLTGLQVPVAGLQPSSSLTLSQLEIHAALTGCQGQHTVDSPCQSEGCPPEPQQQQQHLLISKWTPPISLHPNREAILRKYDMIVDGYVARSLW